MLVDCSSHSHGYAHVRVRWYTLPQRDLPRRTLELATSAVTIDVHQLPDGVPFRSVVARAVSSALASLTFQCLNNHISDVSATSFDPRHGAHVISQNDDAFWVSTGMLPQRISIAFACPVRVSRVCLCTLNVRGVSIGSSAVAAGAFASDAIEQADHFSETSIEVDVELAADAPLSITITAAYAEFVAVRHATILSAVG